MLVFDKNQDLTASFDTTKIREKSFISGTNMDPLHDAIKQAILDHGPVAAAVCVNNEFQSYDSGLFNPRRPCNSINHAIVLTGWDDSLGAWRLRNSWGPNWGEDGYMRIKYRSARVSCEASYLYYNPGGVDSMMQLLLSGQ